MTTLGTEEGFKKDENLFYGSTHEIYAFPNTGPDPSPYVGENSRKPIDRRIVNRLLKSGKVSRKEFREKWQQIFEEMTRFKPDLVIISAGKSL